MKLYAQSARMAPNPVLMGWPGVYDHLRIIYIMRQKVIYVDRAMTLLKFKYIIQFSLFYTTTHLNPRLCASLKLPPRQPDPVSPLISRLGIWA